MMFSCYWLFWFGGVVLFWRSEDKILNGLKAYYHRFTGLNIDCWQHVFSDDICSVEIVDIMTCYNFYRPDR